MTNLHIRRIRRSKHYMAPVLLDHSSQKKLILGMTLALVVVFLSGYVVGFEKAEVKLASFIETVALALPGATTEPSAGMEPQRPLQTEPGETIDVDSADEPSVAKAAEPTGVALVVESQIRGNLPQATVKKPEQEAKPVVVEDKQTASTEVSLPLAIGGPSKSDPEQEADLLIQDNATEETATHSIQVGMYGQLENAEQKVEELIATDISAYIVDYMNRKNEIRYNVRFGYFANYRSARVALATFEKELSGSGYVVRLKSSSRAIVAAESSIESQSNPD